MEQLTRTAECGREDSAKQDAGADKQNRSSPKRPVCARALYQLFPLYHLSSSSPDTESRGPGSDRRFLPTFGIPLARRHLSKPYWDNLSGGATDENKLIP